MLWILAILGLISALWGIAHHLKDADPPPVCIEMTASAPVSTTGVPANRQAEVTALGTVPNAVT